MQEFFNSLTELLQVENLIYYAISLITMLFAWLLKKVIILLIGGIKKMANKTLTEEQYTQIFSRLKDEYQLNEKTNELEKVGTIDIQELIQSSVDSCLSQVLDKFIVNPDINQEVAVPKRIDYLEDMSAHLQEVEMLKEKYKLNEEMTPTQVYTWLETQVKGIKEEIKNGGLKEDETQIDK